MAKYEDSLTTAQALDEAIKSFVASSSQETQQAAKDAWLAARVPYQQTEVYRFGNAIVDDWEGRVNEWPLDENLIDYVDASYGSHNDENGLYAANVIANASIILMAKRLMPHQSHPNSSLLLFMKRVKLRPMSLLVITRLNSCSGDKI